MSSNEDKKLIKFPGAKKELKQGHSSSSPLDSSLQKTQDMSSPSASVGGGSPGSNKVNINESVDSNVDESLLQKYWNRSSLKQGDSSSSGASTDEGESRKYKEPSYYVISSVACAVFLMLVGVSYFNVKDRRDIATSNGMLIMPVKIIDKDGYDKKVFLYEDEKGNLAVNLMERDPDMVIDPDKSKIETWKARLNRQEKQMINLITTGQRRLASIGRKPGMKDRFSMEALKSRYNVRWSRGKLSSAKLLEGQEPVRFPSMDKVVKEYRTLFPHYYAFVKGKDRSDQIKLRDSLNLSSRELVLYDPDQTEVYELRDRENSLVKKIVALRDAQSRLLSVYVVSD